MSRDLTGLHAVPRHASAGAAAVTVSIVSRGSGAALNLLVADLARTCARSLARVIVTLARDEPLPLTLTTLRCDVLVLRSGRTPRFGADHNRAFRFCRTAWFAVLDPGVRLTQDFAAMLIARCDAHDAMVAPRVIDPGGAQANGARRLLTPWQLLRALAGHRKSAPAPPADWLERSCLLMRASAFDAIGGFDAHYGASFEDADLSLRLKLAGWRIRQIDAVTVTLAAQPAPASSPSQWGRAAAGLLRHWASPAFWRYLRMRGAPGAASR